MVLLFHEYSVIMLFTLSKKYNFHQKGMCLHSQNIDQTTRETFPFGQRILYAIRDMA